jgi:hypothetical protein
MNPARPPKPTLAARLFVDIDRGNREAESARLRLLHTELAGQPVEVKERLLKEFLDIAGDRSEKLSARTHACNILGGRRNELGAAGSPAATNKLLSVLERDFVLPSRSGFPFLGGKLRLRQIGPLEFCFLQALLLSLLRLDPKTNLATVENVAACVTSPEWRSTLVTLLEDEKRKLATG